MTDAVEGVRHSNEQQTELLTALRTSADSQTRPKIADSFKAPKPPDAKDFLEWKEALRKCVVARVPSKPYEVTRWWNEIDQAFANHARCTFPNVQT